MKHINNPLNQDTLMKQKYLTMAYELKSNVKLGFDNSYVSVKDGIVSIDRFEDFEFITESESITRICLQKDLDIDSDELIDIIIEDLKDLDRKDRIVRFHHNKPYIGDQ